MNLFCAFYNQKVKICAVLMLNEKLHRDMFVILINFINEQKGELYIDWSKQILVKARGSLFYSSKIPHKLHKTYFALQYKQ